MRSVALTIALVGAYLPASAQPLITDLDQLAHVVAVRTIVDIANYSRGPCRVRETTLQSAAEIELHRAGIQIGGEGYRPTVPTNLDLTEPQKLRLRRALREHIQAISVTVLDTSVGGRIVGCVAAVSYTLWRVETVDHPVNGPTPGWLCRQVTRACLQLLRWVLT